MVRHTPPHPPEVKTSLKGPGVLFVIRTVGLFSWADQQMEAETNSNNDQYFPSRHTGALWVSIHLHPQDMKQTTNWK